MQSEGISCPNILQFLVHLLTNKPTCSTSHSTIQIIPCYVTITSLLDILYHQTPTWNWTCDSVTLQTRSESKRKNIYCPDQWPRTERYCNSQNTRRHVVKTIENRAIILIIGDDKSESTTDLGRRSIEFFSNCFLFVWIEGVEHFTQITVDYILHQHHNHLISELILAQYHVPKHALIWYFGTLQYNTLL